MRPLLHHSSNCAVVRAAATALTISASLSVNTPVNAQEPHQIRLRYATFDPLRSLPLVPPDLETGPENRLYLVQFGAPTPGEWRAAVEAVDGEILRFVTDRTYVVDLEPGSAAALAEMALVRWVGPYHPAYRLHEEVRLSLFAAADRSQRYSIECMRRGMGDQQAVADAVRRAGGHVDVVTPDQFRMEATLDRSQLLEVVHRNEVNFIDLGGGPGEVDMSLIRRVSGAVPLLSTAGFLGQGVRGEIFDSGLVVNHEQWAHRPPLIRSPVVIDPHGSAIYGIVFASGTGEPSATGLLPQHEQGIFCPFQATTQFGGTLSRLQLNAEATDPAGPYRSSFQSASAGSQYTNAYYSTISAETDDYLFEVDYLTVQSLGNYTGFNSFPAGRWGRPQAWSKNALTINKVDLRGTLDWSDDVGIPHSGGPLSDGRQKPDLAHGVNIFTTYSDQPAGYGIIDGSSAATAAVAGHAGLLLQMWHEGVWSGHGGSATVFDSRPKSTTVKAMLINSAHRYEQPSSFQNWLFRGLIGWGVADLRPLYLDRERLFILDWGDPLEHGESHVYRAMVGPGETELRITMTFPDPPGNPAAVQSRINDLTLKVVSPTGAAYWGNHMLYDIPGMPTPNYSLPGGSPNSFDTVENVFIEAPEPGEWIVEVRADEVAQDGYHATPALDAVYSLVIAGAIVGETCYANCDGSAVEPVLNVDDFTCFINQFAAAQGLPHAQQVEHYANCDGSQVAPALNVDDFTCFINEYAQGCP